MNTDDSQCRRGREGNIVITFLTNTSTHFLMNSQAFNLQFRSEMSGAYLESCQTFSLKHFH